MKDGEEQRYCNAVDKKVSHNHIFAFRYFFLTLTEPVLLSNAYVIHGLPHVMTTNIDTKNAPNEESETILGAHCSGA